MGEVAEYGLDQKLVLPASVEAFDELVLHRLAGGDVVPCYVAFCGGGGKSCNSNPAAAKPPECPDLRN